MLYPVENNLFRGAFTNVNEINSHKIANALQYKVFMGVVLFVVLLAIQRKWLMRLPVLLYLIRLGFYTLYNIVVISGDVMIHTIQLEEIHGAKIRLSLYDDNRAVSEEIHQSESLCTLIQTIDALIVAVKGKRKQYTPAELMYIQSCLDTQDIEDNYKADLPTIILTEARPVSGGRYLNPSDPIVALITLVDASIRYSASSSSYQVKNFTKIELVHHEGDPKNCVRSDLQYSDTILRINMVTVQH